MAVDPVFGANDFNQPKYLTEKESLIRNILMIIFGKPGFYPSIPTIGMDIKQYLYKFADDIDTEKLKEELAAECNDFLPEISSGDLDIQVKVYNKKPLIIFILPVLNDVENYQIALGITSNAYGEMIYKFVENRYQDL